MGWRGEIKQHTGHLIFEVCWIRSEGNILKDHHAEKGSTWNPSQWWTSHFQSQIAVVVVDSRRLLKLRNSVHPGMRTSNLKSFSRRVIWTNFLRFSLTQFSYKAFCPYVTQISQILPFMSEITSNKIMNDTTNEIVYMFVIHRRDVSLLPNIHFELGLIQPYVSQINTKIAQQYRREFLQLSHSTHGFILYHYLTNIIGWRRYVADEKVPN